MTIAFDARIARPAARPARARRAALRSRKRVHLSDEALVAQVARLDDGALGELYDRHGRTAYGLALRVVRDPVFAEDAVQEAFLNVWRTARQFVPERSGAQTWLLMLVHRRAVDLVRREERRRTAPIEFAPELEAPTQDPWASLRAAEVRAALQELPDPLRELLELAYFGGLTQSELAERLQVPLGTIKSRTSTALARLRNLLDEADAADAPLTRELHS